MKLMNPSSLMRSLVAAAALSTSLASAESSAGDAWHTSWMASMQPMWQQEGPDGALPLDLPSTYGDVTVRQFVRLSTGGQRVRIVVSNAYGSVPLSLDDVRVALAAYGLRAGTGNKIVTFNGRTAVTIDAGKVATSDPLELAAPALSRLAVSFHLPGKSALDTFHYEGKQTAQIVTGRHSRDTSLQASATSKSRVFLQAVHVDDSATSGLVIAIGDSITDGKGASIDADARWPDLLAARLAPSHIAVANAGISGGRLLCNRVGPAVLERFDRDVLDQPGVAAAFVLIGINDIGWPGTPFASSDEAPTAAAIIEGYRTLIARARASGVRIYAGTLLPFEGALSGSPYAAYYDVQKDAVREQVNAWLRTAPFDGLADFDNVMRDPSNPRRLQARFDSGDHLHPNDAGNAAMAEAVALAMASLVDRLHLPSGGRAAR